MEKKIFEAPEAIVTVFEKADILTLSNGGAKEFPTVKW